MQVGLNLMADEILYDELMAPDTVPLREGPYKGDLPFNRPPPLKWRPEQA